MAERVPRTSRVTFLVEPDRRRGCAVDLPSVPPIEPLAARVILIIEDDYVVARQLARNFMAAGAEVLGPVPDVARALRLMAETPHIDGAVLDVNLKREMVYPWPTSCCSTLASSDFALARPSMRHAPLRSMALMAEPTVAVVASAVWHARSRSLTRLKQPPEFS
jgi:hypothetical protein